MNVRGINTIFRAPRISKNYSNFPMNLKELEAKLKLKLRGK